MKEAVIVSTARTGLAKSWKGALNLSHGATVGGHVVRHAVERAGIDPAEVEDVVMGCATPEGATGSNIARQIAIRAGLPASVPGATVNRFCASGLQAIAQTAQRIVAGEGEVFVAGGVECISTVQGTINQHMLEDAWLKRHVPAIYMPMLQTAEIVAKRYGIDRERQDRYGTESQLRAAAAQTAGRFDDEIVPITVRMAVARLEFTPSMPTLARMDVSAANTAESRANTNHIPIPPFPTRVTRAAPPPAGGKKVQSFSRATCA